MERKPRSHFLLVLVLALLGASCQAVTSSRPATF